MKPKLTTLSKQVICKAPIFEDIPTLKGGVIAPDVEVFDATAFCEEEKLAEVAYTSFYQSCKRYIDAKISTEEWTEATLFFQNTDGHLLVNATIALIFLRYAYPDISTYFDNIVACCLINGAAFSDAFVMRLASNQISDNDLQEIINQRNADGTEQQQ